MRRGAGFDAMQSASFHGATGLAKLISLQKLLRELGQWGSWDTCHKGVQNRTRPVPRCLCDAFGCCPNENGPNAPPH